MTKTEHYQLNQWEPTDKLSRTDFNADNAAIDAALAAKAEKSAVSAVETALANYKTANDAAVAKKADASALTAYQTSNDAAVAKKAEQSALDSMNTTLANVSAKANAAYSASNPPFLVVTISTKNFATGSTVYTFPKAPQCVLLQGDYATVLIPQGASIEKCDQYNLSNDKLVEFKLSGTALILVSREDTSAMDPLTIVAFY